MRSLSKSRFQTGLQCPKALWLSVHRRELATPTSETQQWVFDQGSDVGRLAQQLFPGGIEVTETSEDPQVAALIRAHAEKVMQFVGLGQEAYDEPTPLPDGYQRPEEVGSRRSRGRPWWPAVRWWPSALS